MHRRGSRGFTIVELLVVVSIIALLIGILLPAIGRARDQARQTLSLANLRQLGQAHGTYASDWSDRQFTLVRDDISRYGNSPTQAMGGYLSATGSDHPGIILGWGTTLGGGSGLIGYWMSWGGNHPLVQPIDFGSGFGWFRIPNAKQFSQYLSGRYYDQVFYAPKDRVVDALIQDCLNDPGEFSQCGGTSDTYWSSYCLSPAALYSPDVFRGEDRGGWQDPWQLAGGHRVPALGMALYPELKTHMIEHHWLQQARSDCNPGFEEGTFDGCEPYYFNLGFESIPVSLFYDGHVAPVSVSKMIRDDTRAGNQSDEGGLWSRSTPFGLNGYFQDLSYDVPTEPGRGTSGHILTTNGIRGRDVMN